MIEVLPTFLLLFFRTGMLLCVPVAFLDLFRAALSRLARQFFRELAILFAHLMHLLVVKY